MFTNIKQDLRYFKHFTLCTYPDLIYEYGNEKEYKMRHVFFLLMCSNFLLRGQSDSLNRNKVDTNHTKLLKRSVLKLNSLNFKSKDTAENKAEFTNENNLKVSAITKPGSDSVQKPMEKTTYSNKQKMIKNISNIIPSGSISFGYDYGFLPYTVNTPPPSMAYKSEGKLDLNVMKIPINVSYYYSTQKNIVGLNNYFRITYDADRYKDQMNAKLLDKANDYKNQKGKFVSERQGLIKKMAFADYLSSVDPAKWPKHLDSAPKLSSEDFKTNENIELPEYRDIITLPAGTDTLGGISNKNIDNVAERASYYKRKSDSVKTAYEQYRQQYESISDSIKQIDQKIEKLESMKDADYKNYKKDSPYLNKYQNLISGVKRFEVGLCYPNYSTFLANNLPIRGINLEYNKNKRYFAFTYGTTVSTVLYNSNNTEGVLRNARNAYNYFDFNNVLSGRKIIAAKVGVGIKEGNHFFAGFLIGRGQTSYFSNIKGDNVFTGKETNLVFEADIRYRITTRTTLDVLYGKSSLKGEDINYAVLREELNEIVSKYRSNAFLTKLSSGIKRTNTNISISVRYIDPFFKSFGIGFMRSDNLRYEIKFDQPFGKRIKYSAAFRYEEDNLLKLINYKNRFYSINNTVSYKIKRGLTVRASYTPLLRTLNSENYHQITRNSISTGVVTYNSRVGKTNIQLSVLYNHYVINTDTQQLHFENISYSQQFFFKKGFKTGLSASWFKNSMSDSLNNDVILAIADAGYQFKNGASFSVAGKTAFKLNGKLYPGYIVKCNLRLFKNLFWESQAEKFVVGDLFNGYDLQNLKRFPYYISTKLLLNF